MAQLGVAALDKGWAIAGEPRLDLSHACRPECINIYGLVSKIIIVYKKLSFFFVNIVYLLRRHFIYM
jgi:hypothetical protein